MTINDGFGWFWQGNERKLLIIPKGKGKDGKGKKGKVRERSGRHVVLPVCIVASWYYLLLLHVICASGLVFVLNFLEIDDILVLMSEGKKGKNKDKNDD